MTSSFHFQKSKKITERLRDLKIQAKEFQKLVDEIVENCSAMVEKVKNIRDVKFAEEFATVYRFLLSCVGLFVDFNCRLESLLNGEHQASFLQSPVIDGRFKELERKSSTCSSLRENLQTQPGEGFVPNNIPSNDSSSRKHKDILKSNDRCENELKMDTCYFLDDILLSDSEDNKENSKNTNNPCLVPSSSEGRSDEIEYINETSDVEEELKIEEKRINHLKELEINRDVGVIHQVILSHVVSPDEFYVFVKCQEQQLFEELKKKLSIINRESVHGKPFLNKLSNKRLAAKILGLYAVGFSEELSTWTRIRIIDWRLDEGDDLIRVFHVDHGSSSLLPVSQVLPMDQMIANYPVFVQKCYLSSVVPVEQKWSEVDTTVLELLTEATDEGVPFTMELTENKNREDRAVGVKLFQPNSNVSVNDKLVEFGRAAKETVRKYLPPFAVGQVIPVRVTHIVKANHIFCSKDYGETKERDVQEDLIASLNDPNVIMPHLDEPPSFGQLVVAKFVDGFWYRAQVIKCNRDTGNYRIIFVDYGNTKTISMKDMRKIDRKLLSVPFQMVECFIDGVDVKRDADKHDVAGDLYTIFGEGVTIQIKSVIDELHSRYKVAIFSKDGKDVARELISLGHAVSSNKC